MRALDTYPTVVLSPDGSTQSKLRLVVDESHTGQLLVRAYGWSSAQLPEEKFRLYPVRREGARRHGRFIMGDGSVWSYDKEGSCGCRDAVRDYDVGYVVDNEFDEPVSA